MTRNSRFLDPGERGRVTNSDMPLRPSPIIVSCMLPGENEVLPGFLDSGGIARAREDCDQLTWHRDGPGWRAPGRSRYWCQLGQAPRGSGGESGYFCGHEQIRSWREDPLRELGFSGSICVGTRLGEIRVRSGGVLPTLTYQVTVR